MGGEASRYEGKYTILIMFQLNGTKLDFINASNALSRGIKKYGITNRFFAVKNALKEIFY